MYKANFSLLPCVLSLMLVLPAVAEQAREAPIDIEADSGRFDAERGATRLSGNIRISRGELVVEADEGFAHQLPDRTYERIELSGAPATWRVIDEQGEEVHGRAARIVFDMPGNRLTMEEDVRITRGDLVVFADTGTALQVDGRYQRVELDGSPANWHMTTQDGERAEGESQRIVYELVAERVSMSGNARVREPRGSFTGQRLIYDIRTQATEGEGGIRMVIEPEAREDRGNDPQPD